MRAPAGRWPGINIRNTHHWGAMHFPVTTSCRTDCASGGHGTQPGSPVQGPGWAPSTRGTDSRIVAPPLTLCNIVDSIVDSGMGGGFLRRLVLQVWVVMLHEWVILQGWWCYKSV